MIKKGEFYYMWSYTPKVKQKIKLNKVQIINPPELSNSKNFNKDFLSPAPF